MAEILAEIKKIPFVTRTLLGLSLAVTGPVSLGLLNPYYMNSVALETESFAGRSADYAWTIICLMAAIIGTNYPLKSVIFCGPLMSALGFMWSQINPEALVSLFGLPPIKAAYFPFAMLALDFVRGGMPLMSQSLSGVIAGYAIHYLNNIYPSSNGGQRPWFMYPPSFLTRLIHGAPQTAGAGQRVGGGAARSRTWGGQAPVNQAGARNLGNQGSTTTRHAWGTGNRLG